MTSTVSFFQYTEILTMICLKGDITNEYSSVFFYGFSLFFSVLSFTFGLNAIQFFIRCSWTGSSTALAFFLSKS